MRYLYPIIALIFSLNMAAQKMTAGTFVSSGHAIRYNRIDYSGNGLGQVRIIMYQDIEKNKDILTYGANCLAQLSNLYHCYYYFIKLPNDFTQSKNETALSEFLDHIAATAEYKNLRDTPILYIFSDKEYSIPYRGQEKQPFALEKVLTGLSPKNVCTGL